LRHGAGGAGEKLTGILHIVLLFNEKSKEPSKIPILGPTLFFSGTALCLLSPFPAWRGTSKLKKANETKFQFFEPYLVGNEYLQGLIYFTVSIGFEMLLIFVADNVGTPEIYTLGTLGTAGFYIWSEILIWRTIKKASDYSKISKEHIKKINTINLSLRPYFGSNILGLQAKANF
jgi:hypothetical protein